MDRDTIKILFDLLNPLHGSLDMTVQQERDLCQAVMILESRLRDEKEHDLPAASHQSQFSQ